MQLMSEFVGRRNIGYEPTWFFAHSTQASGWPCTDPKEQNLIALFLSLRAHVLPLLQRAQSASPACGLQVLALHELLELLRPNAIDVQLLSDLSDLLLEGPFEGTESAWCVRHARAEFPNLLRQHRVILVPRGNRTLHLVYYVDTKPSFLATSIRICSALGSYLLDLVHEQSGRPDHD